MKKIITYMLLALFAWGCSNSDIDDSAYECGEDEGGLSISISTNIETKASLSGSTDEMLESSILRIYDSNDALIRRYEPATEMPEVLYLVAGDYSLSLEIGASVELTTDKTDLTYYGESDFTITKEVTSQVAVECFITNSVVTVMFDESSLDNNLNEGYKVTLAIAEDITDNMIVESYEAKLSITEDGSGYFILPEGVDYIGWRFDGVAKSDSSAVSVKGVISGAKSGEENILSFKYSQGVLTCSNILVDTSEDVYEDETTFQLLYAQEVDFDSSEVQSIADQFQYNVVSDEVLSDITIEANGAVIAPLINGETQSLEDASFEFTHKATPLLNREEGVLTINSSAFENFITVDDDVECVTMYIKFSNVSGMTNTQSLSVYRSDIALPDGKISIGAMDLWKNTIALTATVNIDFASAVVELREVGESDWQSVEFTASDVVDGVYVANFGAIWSAKTNDAGLTYYTPSGGVWANSSYECRLMIDGVESATKEFDSDTATQSIPDGNMNSSLIPCFTTDCSSSTSWGSGNNTFTRYLCEQVKLDGATCVKMETGDISGIVAAGNLFFGQFEMISLMTGQVSFGQPFTWSERPRSLKVKYAADLAVGDIVSPDGVGYSHDRGRIYLAIVDWDARHIVTSGTDAPTGVWDPTTQNETDEGNIIGYASMFIDENTSVESLTQLELPIYYYDTETKPTGVYSLVISCASSAYGDYITGVEGSKLYVDDFEFGY